MSRRMVQSIRNSFYVYLPKEWCKQYDVRKGSEVQILQTEEGLLTIYPPGSSVEERRETVINVDEQGWRSTPVLLVGAYITGFSKVEMVSKSTFPLEWREEINMLSRKLLGFEVIEESDHSMILADVSTSYDLLPILRRAFTSFKYMLDGLVKCVGTCDPKDAQIIINRDDDVDRYRYAVERLSHLAIKDSRFRSHVNVTVESCLKYGISSKYIERMADHATGIATEILKGRRMSKKLGPILKQTIGIYDTVTKAFFSRKIKLAEPVLFDSRKIIDDLRALGTESASIQEGDLKIFHLERILSYCADLAEVAIDLVIAQNGKPKR